MKKIVISLVFILFEVSAFAQEWTLVYEHDAQGQAIQGNKQELISAVRAGKDIKLGWKMGAGERSVEHYAEVQFLSIIKDEVFGQITKILSQRPSLEKVTIEFLESTEWSMIASTSGKNATIMQNIHDDSKKFSQTYLWGNKWFVKTR